MQLQGLEIRCDSDVFSDVDKVPCSGASLVATKERSTQEPRRINVLYCVRLCPRKTPICGARSRRCTLLVSQIRICGNSCRLINHRWFFSITQASCAQPGSRVECLAQVPFQSKKCFFCPRVRKGSRCSEQFSIAEFQMETCAQNF